MKSLSIVEEYVYEVIWLDGLKEEGKVYKDDNSNWNIRNSRKKKSSKYKNSKNSKNY